MVPEQKQPQRKEDRQLSAVLENYLEIIFRAEAKDGAARASSIAEVAGVSRSTVTSALKTLKKLGLIEYAPYSLIHLTEEGLHIGRDIVHRHMVFQEFFEHILLLDPRISDSVACELEHVVPAEVIRRIGQFVLYLRDREPLWQNWPEEYEKLRLGRKHAGKASGDEATPSALSPRGRPDSGEGVPDSYR